MTMRAGFSVFLFLLLSVSVAFASEAGDAALSMVKTLRLGNNLVPMALQVATSTQTYSQIVNEVGDVKAKGFVMVELDNALPEFQEQWNKNLAQSYAAYFDPSELRSIASEKQASKYFPKFQAKQTEVGKMMQDKSRGLLDEFVTEAVTKAFKRVAK